MKKPATPLEDLLANDAWVRSLARRLVSDEHAAEDLVQDTWLAALERQQERPNRVRAWLGGVLRNLAGKRNRALARCNEHERQGARLDRLPSVAEVMDQETTRLRLVKATFSLEEPYRSAIIYRYFKNLPPRTIAEQLDMTVEAVKKRITRGLQQLRGRLDREFGDRKTWFAALLPLCGKVSMEAAAGAASASILTGALVMSTKVKIGIAVLAGLGVAYAFWPRDGVKPPEVPESEVSKPMQAAAKTTPDTGPAAAKAVEARPGPPEETTPVRSTAAAPMETKRGAIVGPVTDPGGAPIAGASVRALRYHPGVVELEERLATRTDAAGRYTLEPLEARCVVEASARGHYTERRLASPFTRADFVLGTPGVLRGKLVLAADLTPCADATVAVYDWRRLDALHNLARTYAWQRPPVAMVHSDRAGKYRFDRLRPGRYQLYILPRENPPIHTLEQPIEVSSGQEVVRDFAVSTGIKIVGKVTDAGSGRPIAGAAVYQHNNYRKRTVTGADGRYAIAGIDAWPEFDTVVAEADGYAPTYSQLQPIAALTRERVIDLAMKRGAMISGRVLGPEGKPVAGARVGISSLALRLPTQLWASVSRATTTTTDEDGIFRLVVRPTEKERRVHAGKDGLGWGASKPFVPKAGAKVTGIQLRLPRCGAVAGRVTDAAGSPIDSARVTLSADRGRIGRCAYTRPDGRYEMEGIPDGTYDLRVLPPGALADARSPFSGLEHKGVTVSGGGRTEVNLVLRRGPTLTGRVVDAGGRALDNVLVRALPWFSPSVITMSLRAPCVRVACTDARGRFRIEGLWDVEKKYFLQAVKAGYEQGYAREIRPGSAEVLITLQNTRKLKGRVLVGSTGRPAIEFRIQGFSVPGPGSKERRRMIRFSNVRNRGIFTDLEGRFMLHLKPGTYEIEAQAPGGLSSETRRIEVPAVGDPEFLELEVWEGATVCGRIVSLDGKPLDYTGISLYDLGTCPGKWIRSGRADTAGRFEFSSLPLGTYLLAASGNVRGKPRFEGTRKVRLTVAGQKDIRLTLGPGTEVEVRVAQRDKKPIAGATVDIARTDRIPYLALRLSERLALNAFGRAQREAGHHPSQEEYRQSKAKTKRRLTVTGKDGTLATLHLIPGEYEITATATDHKPWKKTISIGSGLKKTLDIVLEKE